MIHNKNVVAVIPARSGSKGIPKKNLYKLDGISLLERAIRVCKKCPLIDRIMVSTDDEEMQRLAKQFDVSSKSLRPKELATDNASSIDVIKHCLDEMNLRTGYVILVQVSTPLRTSKDLKKFIEAFANNCQRAMSMVSVCEYTGEHPEKLQTIEGGWLKSYLNKNSHVSRQQLQKLYRLNGAFYITKVESIYKYNTFFSTATMPYVMPESRSLNLDTMENLRYLEYQLNNKLVVPEDLTRS